MLAGSGSRGQLSPGDGAPEQRPAGTVAIPEMVGGIHAGMDTPNKRDPPDRPEPTKLAPGYSHLLMRDTRTPEEQLVASLKELATR